MAQIQKILVPYDFSENSRQALATALQLSRRYGSELMVLTVVEQRPKDAVSSLITPPQEVSSRLKQKIHEEISALISEADRSQARFQVEVRKGKASLEILLTAERERADLVVMGSKGRTGLSRILLGSVAESVVRRAGVPVWVCRGSNARLPQRILVPVDFSEYSRQALDEAVRWAKNLKAEIYLLHVVDSRDFYILDPLGLDTHPVALEAKLKKQAEEELQSWAKTVSFPVKFEVRWGVPVNEIQASVQRDSIDLVVLATHGRMGLKHLVIGSVAEQVVRYSACSVMTLCPPAFAFSNLKLFEGQKDFEDYMRSFRD